MSDPQRESVTHYRADDGREAVITIERHGAPTPEGVDTFSYRVEVPSGWHETKTRGFFDHDATLAFALGQAKRLLGDDALSRNQRPVARRALAEK